MLIELFFDVETQKMFSDILNDDPGLLGVSVVSVYRRELDTEMHEYKGEMKSFWHPDANLYPQINDLWEWFLPASRIIGFNSKKFDIRALTPYFQNDLSVLPHFDLLEIIKNIIGRRISLNALAQDTLGSNKIDNGNHAVLYWARRDAESLKKLQKYCEADVFLTKELYDYARINNHLKYMDKWNRLITVPVDFSYPIKKANAANQIGLF